MGLVGILVGWVYRGIGRENYFYFFERYEFGFVFEIRRGFWVWLGCSC